MANFNIDYLIVAGGGGGGMGYYGGGGGAGGLLTNVGGTSLVLATGGSGYTITVGDGGSAATSRTVNGTNGFDSQFNAIVANGGGGAGSRDTTGGSSGGSGGGSANPNNAGGSGTVGQGNDGGTLTGQRYGSGGGGANQAGQIPPQTYSQTPQNYSIGAPGGNGLEVNIIGGTGNYYAGGGGAGARSTYSPNGINGGLGGGGAGGAYLPGSNGIDNTGGGGGGGGYQNDSGGNGGSGIVILRYATADANYTATGLTPTETIDGTDTILSFTTVGTGTITFTTPIPPFIGNKVTTPVTDFNKPNTEEGLKIPSGTASEQPTGVTGMVRNDTNQSSNGSLSAITYYNGTNWRYFENKPEPIGSIVFEPASSIASGQINANKPLGQNFTFTRASTATFLGSNNLLQTAASGMPRIDYLGNTGGHILLEPARTNIFQQSNNLANNTWWAEINSVSLTSSDKNITSPTGAGNDAWTLTTNSGGGLKKVGVRMRNNGANNHGIPPSTSKVMSIFVKKSSYDFIYFNSQKFQSDMNGDTWFNISNGTLGTISANHTSTKIEDYGNGWYRLSATVTAPASPTDNTGQFSWHVANANGETNVTEDGTSTSFWYGGQIEGAEYSTSYIETNTASVTRVAETASGAGNSTLFNDSEGVFFVEIAALANDGTDRRITISNSSVTSQLICIEYDTQSNTLHAFLYNNSFQAEFTHTLNDISTFVKVGFKYKENDFALWVNGFEVGTDNSGSVFPNNTLNVLKFENSVSLNKPFYGKVKEVRVYKTALTDAELASLTT